MNSMMNSTFSTPFHLEQDLTCAVNPPASRALPCTSHGTPTCEVLSIQQEQAVPQDPCPDMLEHVGTVGILKFVSRISNWIKSAYTICIYIYKYYMCMHIYIHIMIRYGTSRIIALTWMWHMTHDVCPDDIMGVLQNPVLVRRK